MTLTEATKTCFQKYSDFSGRAPRAEYWKFVLFLMIAEIALVIVNSLFFGPEVEQVYKIRIDSTGQQSQETSAQARYVSGWIGNVVALLTLTPFLAVTWRRMHDINWSGWICLVPLAINIVSYVVLFTFFTTETAIDQSALPAGLEMPETISVPTIGTAFFVLWLTVVIPWLAFLLLFLAKRSDPDTNRYGPYPYEVPT